MKKKVILNILLVLLLSINNLMAQMPLSKIKEQQTQAHQLANKKEYKKALHLYSKVFGEYSTQNLYQAAIDCGMEAANICIAASQYKEAFEWYKEITKVIGIAATKSGQLQNVNYFNVAKERFMLNMKLKNQVQSDAQLTRLQALAVAMQDTTIDNNLLYMQSAYDYMYGKNNAGDSAFNRLIDFYNQRQEYEEVNGYFRSLIDMSLQMNNSQMMDHIYKNYMVWNDSIQNIEAQDKITKLEEKYGEVLFHMSDKEDQLSYRLFIIVGTCILLGIITFLLILLFINQMRLKANNHRCKRRINSLQEFSELKSQFIHNISTHLQPSLSNFSEVASQLPANFNIEKQQILQQSDAIKNYLNHIDELSELELSADKLYETQSINVKSFCDGIAKKVTPNIKNEVTLNIEVPKIEIEANKEQLSRILIHLLQNAVSHTNEGTIRLEFKKRGAHLHQFIVSDTGSGVSQEMQSQLFKPFKKIDDLTKGDGLGLPICKMIAKKMNGSLVFDSTYKKGARFILDLRS